MLKKIIALAYILLLASCSYVRPSTDWYIPTRENKPYVRWWWLGSAVDREGLDYNLTEFADKGIGGVEITPIYGVKGNEDHDISYLSPEWMEVLRYTIQKAEALDIEVDMSNCTGWPFGGPWIGPEHAAKTFAFDADTTHFLMAGTGQMVKRAAPGGVGFVMDHYSREALDTYLAPFDSAFAQSGCPFPSCFFNDSFEVYGAGWTDRLPEEFYNEHGYRIEDHIKAFAANDGSPESSQLLADYRSTLGRLYMENFVLPWREWAHSHGVRTRHQAHGAPANLVDVYAAADIPECESFGQSPFDISGLHRTGDSRPNDADPAVFKFASSAAHLTGKPYTSCETLTWLTEHFHTSLALCKPEIDLVLASGVNHIVFHGAPYSPAGSEFPGWKFYASVNMSPTNKSIWEVSKPLFDYITRCQSFLSAGEPDADMLIYFPYHDILHHHHGKQFMMLDIHKMNQTMPQFKEDVLSIIRSGYDVDYVSDALLEGVEVSHGMLVTAAGTRYKGLVLPTQTEFMPEATRQKISALRDAGARIVTMDGLDGCGVLPEPAMMMPGVHMVRRSNEAGGKNYFIANLGPSDIRELELACDSRAVEIFDPMTGCRGMAQIISREDGMTRVRVDLRSGESVLLKTFRHAPSGSPQWKYLSEASEAMDLTASEWDLIFVRSTPPMPQQSYHLSRLMPWSELEGGDRNEAVGVYSVDFVLPETLSDEYVLDLGDVRESAVVRVNGTEVGTLLAAPFELRIGEFLHPGANHIEMEVRNLPANRIAQMDRDGVIWRIFKDANVATVVSRRDESGHTLSTYEWWPVVPSGLIGPVRVVPMEYY